MTNKMKIGQNNGTVAANNKQVQGQKWQKIEVRREECAKTESRDEGGHFSLIIHDDKQELDRRWGEYTPR